MSSFRQLMMKKKGGGTQTLNATVVGSPTITSDFIVSGFSQESIVSTNGNYLIANIENDYRTEYGKPFEFVIKIKPYSFPTGSGKNYFFGYYDGLYLGIKSTGEVTSRVSSSLLATTLNAWSWVKLTNLYEGSYSGNGNFKILGSSDGINYTFAGGDFSGTFMASSPIGRTISNTAYANMFAFDGEIDMKETYMKIGDEIVWQGVI